MTTTPTLSRATGPVLSVAAAPLDAPASSGDVLPDRDYFNGCATPQEPVLILLDVDLLRAPCGAPTSAALVAARAFTLEGA